MKTITTQRICDEWGIENNVLYQTQQNYVDALEDTFYALEDQDKVKVFPTYYNMNKFISSHNITVTLAVMVVMNCLQSYKHHKDPTGVVN